MLHDTFDVSFDQIGELLDRSPAAARQLASRARRRVRAAGTGEAADPRRQRAVVDAFFTAARSGDFDRLVAVLHPDVELCQDSGVSPTTIVRGPDAVARNAVLFANPEARLHRVLVDGRPGVIVTVGGSPVSLMAFTVLDGRIAAIDAYAGPVRLAGIDLPTA